MGLMDLFNQGDIREKLYSAASRNNVPQGGITGKLFSAMFPHGLGNLAFGREPEPMPPLETPEGTALMADLASNMMVPGTFIGPKGLARLFGDDAAKGIIATAESKLAQGVPKEAVFQELGVFKGPEGKWRYEIDDSARAVNDYPFSPMDAYKSRREDAWIREEDMAPVNAMKPYTNKTTQELIDEYKRTGGEIVDAAQADNMDLARKLMDDRAGLDGLLSAMADRRYGPASTYMAHDDLYAAYPDFKDMHIRKDDYLDARGQYRQGDHTRGEQIELKGYPRMDKGSTLLHELQHAVQEREGFARGGSPQMFEQEAARYRQDMMRLDARHAIDAASEELGGWPANNQIAEWWKKELGQDLPEWALQDARQMTREELEQAVNDYYSTFRALPGNVDTHSAYQRLAGEAEARAVQDRMNMSMDERRALFPEYAGRNDLIVRGNSGGGLMAALGDDWMPKAERIKKLRGFVFDSQNSKSPDRVSIRNWNDTIAKLEREVLEMGGEVSPKLVGYEWRNMDGEVHSKWEDGVVAKKVSDWDRKEKSGRSNRDIVHVYWIRGKDGTAKPFGKQSAMKELVDSGAAVDERHAEFLLKRMKEQGM